MLMSLSVVQFEAFGRLIPGWSAEADGCSTQRPPYQPISYSLDDCGSNNFGGKTLEISVT
jgi:hypothetical protein